MSILSVPEGKMDNKPNTEQFMKNAKMVIATFTFT